MEEIDVAIVGAGVIGLAVAARVAHKNKSVFIFEKESSFGQEASSRNSEVIHAGIYYPAGSLKARTCVEGKLLLYEFCEKAHIPYKRCGKLIVARDDREVPQLEKLLEKGKINGVDDLRIIDARTLHGMEPNVRGVAALVSPSTGIVDSHCLMQRLLGKAQEKGADVMYQAEVLDVQSSGKGFQVSYKDYTGEICSFYTRVFINCAGLHGDRLAEKVGIDLKQAGYALHYCKGEYFRVVGQKADVVNRLIYPVPDLISLGVHLTPDLGNGLRIGPNAVYVDRDVEDYAVGEERKAEFLTSAKALVPSLEEDDIYPDTAGIRPKLYGPGEEVRDFVVAHEAEKGFVGFINLLGIESPGLTACVSIGSHVGRMVDDILT